MTTRAHVVGAGLAGLSAAVALAEAGFAVTLSEGAAHAGGRCRSYHDPQLGLMIDNGNHLLLSGNVAARAYLARIGAADALTGPDEARFAFCDLRDRARWHVRPNRGLVPWWIASRARRVPGTRLRDHLPLVRLLAPGGGAMRPGTNAIWERLLGPVLLAALNTAPAEASARLAAAVMRGTLAKGGGACRPLIARESLAAAFVDPALAWLARRGAAIRLRRRLRAIVTDAGHVTQLDFADGAEPVAPGEPVVLALPAWSAAALVPGLTTPDAHRAIVNAHFRVVAPPGAEPLIGVIGGMSEWVFAFPDRLSVTISAADRLLGEDREDLARRLWREVAAVHGMPDALPAWQIVSEKRATFAATPAQDARRPAAATRWRNLLLAGDWTQTGLPATIEGAIRSGATAARLAMRVAHAPA